MEGLFNEQKEKNRHRPGRQCLRPVSYTHLIDTVGIGNKSNWNFDPYEGYENDTEIGGRGVSDQCGGIVSAVYGARIMKDLGLLSDKYTVLVTGTVQEEDCDGLCWQYIIHEDGVRPEFVVSTEPTADMPMNLFTASDLFQIFSQILSLYMVWVM